MSRLTPDELQKVFDTREPVVLRGLGQVLQWPAMHKWSRPEYLEQRLPYMKVCEPESEMATIHQINRLMEIFVHTEAASTSSA